MSNLKMIFKTIKKSQGNFFYTYISRYLYILLIISAISVSASAEFVLGIYGVKDKEEIPTIKQAGFNTVQTYNKDPEYLSRLAEKAKQYDMKLLIYPNKIIGSEYENEAHNYPIKAWYICDEPNAWHLSREDMMNRNNVCKKTFPEHQTAFVIGKGKTKIPYYDICDILMMDYYPVPRKPLESFGKNVSFAKQGLIEAGCPQKQLWAVVQIFDYKELKKPRKYGRFPTREEIRFMSYDALFNGATGLFYFTYNSKGVPLPYSKPKEWKYISEIIQELSFIGKIIDSGKEVKSFVNVKKPLRTKTYKYEEKKYIIVENPTNEMQELPKLFFNKKKFEVLFEKSSNLEDIISKGKKNFQPYQVIIFKSK